VVVGENTGWRGLVTKIDHAGCLVVFDPLPRSNYASARWLWFDSVRKLGLCDLIGELA